VAIFVPHAGCPYLCGFCNQRTISGAGRIPDDTEIGEILKRAAESLGERTRTAEIAFFGGSFTAIPRAEMLRLLKATESWLGEGGFTGIRISTRPDAIDAEVLNVLAAHGVTAIELGAQSMDDRVLAASGRGHTAADTVRAANLIRARGFSLGVQMMLGLPGDSAASDRDTADKLIALQSDMARIYPVLVLDGTALAKQWRAGTYKPLSLDEAAERCADALERFTEAGVRVIRLGLHDDNGLRGAMLAGPYHPAFRELCEGRILLRKAFAALAGVPPGNVILRVAPGSTSKIAGQRRCNLIELERLDYRAKIVEDGNVPYLGVKVGYGKTEGAD
jgi:histone acetyltransferase (RNA polymerase elongator complex component)